MIVPNIRQAGSTPTRWLITGHEGTGKTTDMKLLQRQLEQVEHADSADGRRVKFPAAKVLFVDASPPVSPTRPMDVTDLLLAIWQALESTDWDASKKVLLEVWKTRINDALAKTVKNLPEKVGAAIAHLAPFLRGSEASHVELQQSLQRTEAALMQGLNDAFEVFRRTDSTVSVVLIIDNLEKLASRGFEARQLVSAFANRVGSLSALSAHIILTIPVALAYSSDGRAISNALSAEMFTVPHLRVRGRDARQGPCREGVELMSTFVTRRIDRRLFDTPEDTLHDAAAASGGNFRELLRLVGSAQKFAIARGANSISGDDLRHVIARSVQQYESHGLERHASLLAAVERTCARPKECDDATWFDLLARLYVLELEDGEGRFFVTHPLVLRTRAVQEAAR